jgi:hypothetical protein
MGDELDRAILFAAKVHKLVQENTGNVAGAQLEDQPESGGNLAEFKERA